ncbi:MAG: hypothetical protein MMC33_007500 [Icmadophila ericetorum]|nr:hypothetical protein [Icmadophila ericetorum]
MAPLRTDIGLKDVRSEHPSAPAGNDTYSKDLETEVLIVGAGFGGLYLLYKLRELGYKCKLYEAGTDMGGVWHWNCYPGARVDTNIPIYEYSIDKVWEDWYWEEKFPGYAELRRYFNHVEKKLDLKKDIAFNTRVIGAEFDQNTSKWVVKSEDGKQAKADYFILACGFAAKRHFPDYPGLDTFEGIMHHSSFWPNEDVDVKDKRVAVIGTGSTGVQITQETAHKDNFKSLTAFVRTPNLCLPMRQKKVTKEEQDAQRPKYPEQFKHRLTTFAGFSYDFVKRKTFDDTAEEREAFFEQLWDHGGFEFWLATYEDMLFDKAANRAAYDFWAKKTRPRINDPKTRDILAPLEPPHAFGTKRPSLEQDYYEQFNKPNVHVIDVNQNHIKEFQPKGIVTADGQLHEFDVIALATGFDSVTGGMKSMGLKGIDGIDLSEKWRTGPTAFSNGPSCVEVQADWILDAIQKLKQDHIAFINPTKDAEESWRQTVKEISDKSLFPGTSSWYMGANVPGKPREQLNYAGGLPLYQKECRESLDGWKGFEVRQEAQSLSA